MASACCSMKLIHTVDTRSIFVLLTPLQFANNDSFSFINSRAILLAARNSHSLAIHLFLSLSRKLIRQKKKTKTKHTFSCYGET